MRFNMACVLITVVFTVISFKLGLTFGESTFPYYAQYCIQTVEVQTAKELYHCMLMEKNK